MAPDGTAVATRKKNVPATARKMGKGLRGYMEKRLEHAAIASSLTHDRVVGVALQTIAGNPDLLECSPPSLVRATAEAASVGLLVNGFLGEAALVPRWNKGKGCKEAHFQPMYRGKIALALRNGAALKIEARVVRDGDDFDFEYGIDPKLTHRPATSEDDESRKLTHAYAIAWLPSGETQFEVLDRSTVMKIKSTSQMQNGDLWTKWEAEAWRKTAVHRLGKYLDLSPEARAVWSYDGLVEAGEPARLEVDPETEVITPIVERETRTDTVRGAVASKAAQVNGDAQDGDDDENDDGDAS